MGHNPRWFNGNDASSWLSSCVGDAMREVSWEVFSKTAYVRDMFRRRSAGKGQGGGDDYQGGDDDAASVASGHSRWSAPSVAPSGRNWGW